MSTAWWHRFPAPTGVGRTVGTRPWSFVSDHVAALSRPGAARLVPARSALISRARAFRAALEPLIPLLRKTRRDTGFPAAASLLAIRRAWLVSVWPGALVLGPGRWSCRGTAAVLAGGPVPAGVLALAVWSGDSPAWSP